MLQVSAGELSQACKSSLLVSSTLKIRKLSSVIKRPKSGILFSTVTNMSLVVKLGPGYLTGVGGN